MGVGRWPSACSTGGARPFGRPLGDVEVSIVPKGRHWAAGQARTGADGAFSFIVEPELACPATLVAKVHPVLKLHTAHWVSVEIPAVPATGIDVRVSAAGAAR